MSLLDMLLNEPSAAERAMGVISSMQSAPSTPGGGRGLGPPQTGAGTAPHQLAIDIARWIERKPGFEVAALRGWEGQGPITSGHIENSQHYGPGYAGDVNYVGGGRFGGEDAALSWLDKRLDRRYGDALTELLWHVPDHYDHLHYGTRPGG